MGTEDDFLPFLSAVSSRLRHDLKGGLITMKMGLESLDDEEALKPLLLEKTVELAELSDKLILLLMMAAPKLSANKPGPVFQEAAKRAEDQFSDLDVAVNSEGLSPEVQWELDPESVVFAVLEIAQNAALAKAKNLTIELSEERAEFRDDGEGLAGLDKSNLKELGVSHWERSGIGLTIVDRCARAHGGSFEVMDSEQGFACMLSFSSGYDR